jgi:hypothetical protein
MRPPANSRTQAREDRIEVAVGVRMHDLDFQSKSAGPHLHVSYEGLGIGTPPIEEHSDQGRRGNQLMQQLEPFRPKLHTQCGYAREIAAWPIEAGNPTQLDRSAAT